MCTIMALLTHIRENVTSCLNKDFVGVCSVAPGAVKKLVYYKARSWFQKSIGKMEFMVTLRDNIFHQETGAQPIGHDNFNIVC